MIVLFIRLSRYNKFSVSHKLEKFLGDVESKADQAWERGSEKQVDSQLSQLVGENEWCQHVLKLKP